MCAMMLLRTLKIKDSKYNVVVATRVCRVVNNQLKEEQIMVSRGHPARTTTLYDKNSATVIAGAALA